VLDALKIGEIERIEFALGEASDTSEARDKAHRACRLYVGRM